MNSKKGFTLVELLAVIAILAILVIIAIPNVLNLYRNARKNVFLDDAQSVLRTANQQYLEDSISETPVYCYSNEKNPLDLDAKSTLTYRVDFDSNGVKTITVKDNNYSITATAIEGSSLQIDSLKSTAVQTKGATSSSYGTTTVTKCE